MENWTDKTIYEPNITALKPWLNAGGAELVLDVVRRMGWPVYIGDEWADSSDVVAISGYVRGCESISINCKKSGYKQAIAAVAACQGMRSYLRRDDIGFYPVFRDDSESRMSPWDIRSVLNFCDIVRLSVEAAEQAQRKGNQA